MLVGVASLPPPFPPSRTQAFYIIKRQKCLNICNRVYVRFLIQNGQLCITHPTTISSQTLFRYYLISFFSLLVFTQKRSNHVLAILMALSFYFQVILSCLVFIMLVPWDYKITANILTAKSKTFCGIMISRAL